jgi:putative phage-type endonuclease
MMTMQEREQFVASRKTGIGGTDAAAILGVSPYKTPLQVYSEKVGLLDEPDLGELERIEWGNRLEPYIAEAYAERTGRDVFTEPGMIRHPDHPYIFANVDRGVEDRTNGRGLGVLECKNVGEWMSGEWEPHPPIHYAVQLQHYLMVRDLAWGSFGALLGGNRLHVVDVERDDAFCAQLLAAEVAFWERIERRDPPPPGPLDRETLARLFPRQNFSSVLLPAEATDWDNELRPLKDQVKALEERREHLENLIKGAIGENETGLLPAGGKYTWKAQERKVACPKCEHVLSHSTFRVLRRGK